MSIALGQYIPGKSIFHKADPRTKIIWTLAIMVLILLCGSFAQYGVMAAAVIISIIIAKISPKMLIKCLKPLLFLMCFTVFFNLFFYKGENIIWSLGIIKIYEESIWFSIKLLIRITLLVISASLLTFTTTAVSITDGLESLMKPLAKIHFPAHELAMMMSIALRFIPIFADETEKIIKAQTSRGAEFDSGNMIAKVKAYIPVLIPLFVNAFRSAEDMATAMEARCYTGGEGRTKFKILKFSVNDLLLVIFTAILAAGVVLMKVFKI